MCNSSSQLVDPVISYLTAYSYDAAVRDAHLIGGGAVGSLEDKLREQYGFEFVVLTSSGTAGLFITALAIDLSDAQFIASVYGYGATLSAWLALRNTPVFVDIDHTTLNVDPSLIASAVNEHSRAILSTDLFGVPSDTEAIREIADRHGIWYVADGCQAFGATVNRRAASYLADAHIVSFTSGKDLAIGEGGAVLTNDADLYRRLLWVGQHPYRQKRELGISTFNPFAINARIHPVAAVWGSAIFETSLERVHRKQEIYSQALSVLDGSGLIERFDPVSNGLLPSYFCLAVEPRVPVAEMIDALLEEGFASTAFKPPAMAFHQSDILKGMLGERIGPGSSFPVAERVAEKYIALTVEKYEGGKC